MKAAAARDRAADGGRSGPRHVAIIMDGNGRWAKKRFLPRIVGHRKGVEAVRRAVETAPDLGIDFLTLYAFSSENWKRPEDEISDLMGLLRHYLVKEIDALHANNVKLMVIGNYRELSAELVEMLDFGIGRTAGNTGLTLVLALNYGGQDEIARAVRALAADVAKGALEPEAIDPQAITARLDTSDLPPVDLIIRTSGEVRLSNFLLWQAAYAELLFLDTLWPDFDEKALADAVNAYAGRSRRYGAL